MGTGTAQSERVSTSIFPWNHYPGAICLERAGMWPFECAAYSGGNVTRLGGASSVAPGVSCAAPGEWPRTTDAAWLARAIRAAGYRRTNCTGSAFVIQTQGRTRSGHDLYVWTTRGDQIAESGFARSRVGGVQVLHDRVRAVWHVRMRNVWVEAGPTTRLPPVARLGSLILATRRTH